MYHNQKVTYITTDEIVTVLRELPFADPEFGAAVLFKDSTGKTGMDFRYFFYPLRDNKTEVTFHLQAGTIEEEPVNKFEEKPDTLFEEEVRNIATYPINSQYTVSKGKQVWTIDGHHHNLVHVVRSGTGRNSMYVEPFKLKPLK